MDNNNQFLSTLIEKENELKVQLEALRTTIKLFQNGGNNNSVAEVKPPDNRQTKQVPQTFEEAITWPDKVLFVLGKLGSAFVTEIVQELQKYIKEDEEVLLKRITGVASAMKSKEILGAKPVGVKFKYYIK